MPSATVKSGGLIDGIVTFLYVASTIFVAATVVSPPVTHDRLVSLLYHSLIDLYCTRQFVMYHCSILWQIRLRTSHP